MTARNPEPATGEQATKLSVQRVIDAPVELVFNAWLDPLSIGRWLFATPDGEMVRVEVDPSVGGKFTVVEKRGEALAEHFGTYLEIVPPRRLVFSFATNVESNPTVVTVEFRPVDGGCELTLSHELAPEWAHFADRARAGWTMILDGLAATVASEREVVSTRVFAAAREDVFRAFSDPVRLAQWWGPSGFSNTIHAFDLRPGGLWRLTMHGPDGVDYDNVSQFIEVTAPERIVFEHLEPVHRFGMTMTWDNHADGTKLTWQMRFESADELSRMKQFIVPANEQNFDRLAEHLKLTVEA